VIQVLLWAPLAAGLVAVLVPGRISGWVATLGALVSLVLGVVVVAGFDPSGGLQHTVDESWIPTLGVRYQLGVDGISLFLVLLTAVLWFAATLWSAINPPDRPRNYFLMFGLAETAVLGAFLAQDLILFVLFFDLMLIPFYFLVGMWGSGERIRATTKLVVYTLVGSFFMLVAAIATGVLVSSQNGTPLNFALSALQHLPLSHASQEWIFLCFAFAFFVKMPLVPFHGWLADGYKSMPIPAVAVFSGVVSKVAAYGFLRIVLPLFPFATVHFQMLLLIVALVSILWSTAVAFTTPDARLVVAYSSVAQLSFITLGIFSLQPTGAQGALFQMLNHGLVTAPLFFIVAALAARAGGSEMLKDMGGIAFRAPVLAALALIVTFATLAMPGSANFIGEFNILLGVFQSKLAISIIAFAGVVGAAYYALRLYVGAMHNRAGPKVVSREIGLNDAVVLVPIVLVILALAFYPQFGLRRTEQSVKAAVAPTQLVRAASANPYTVAQR